MLYQTNNAGEGTAPAKFCSALQHRAFEPRRPKNEERPNSITLTQAKLLLNGFLPSCWLQESVRGKFACRGWGSVEFASDLVFWQNCQFSSMDLCPEHCLCRVLGESRGGDRMERGAGLAELRWGSKGGRSRGGDPMHFTSPSQHFVISGVSKSLSSVEQPFDSVHQLILNIKLINITC